MESSWACPVLVLALWLGPRLGSFWRLITGWLRRGRWSRQLVLDVATTFEQYIVPTADADTVVIDAPVDAPVGAPLEIAQEFPLARRPRMGKAEFTRFGYTGGCLVAFTCRPARLDLVITMKLAERKLRSVLRRRLKAELATIVQYNDVRISLRVNLTRCPYLEECCCLC